MCVGGVGGWGDRKGAPPASRLAAYMPSLPAFPRATVCSRCAAHCHSHRPPTHRFLVCSKERPFSVRKSAFWASAPVSASMMWTCMPVCMWVGGVGGLVSGVSERQRQ